MRRAIYLPTLLLLLLSLFAGLAADKHFADLPPELTAPPNASNAATLTVVTNAVTATPAVVETNLPASTGTNNVDALDTKHILAIGDKLSLKIVEDEEEPIPLLVTDSGDLAVPYLGRFPAVGKTCKELAMALKAELEKELYYKATVIVAVDVMTRSRGKVYLVGAVRAPGPQEIPSDEVLTLSKAILRAGGFSDFADKKNVKVTRKSPSGNGDQYHIVNVAIILEKGVRETDMPLEPDDLIYIPERSIRF
jgi:protein involved in polysaccharide export with SLBB domain